jgi:hypothetical protein
VETFAFGEGGVDQGTWDTVTAQIIKANVLEGVSQLATQAREFVHVASEVAGDIQDRDHARASSLKRGDHARGVRSRQTQSWILPSMADRTSPRYTWASFA